MTTDATRTADLAQAAGATADAGEAGGEEQQAPPSLSDRLAMDDKGRAGLADDLKSVTIDDLSEFMGTRDRERDEALTQRLTSEFDGREKARLAADEQKATQGTDLGWYEGLSERLRSEDAEMKTAAERERDTNITRYHRIGASMATNQREEIGSQAVAQHWTAAWQGLGDRAPDAIAYIRENLQANGNNIASALIAYGESVGRAAAAGVAREEGAREQRIESGTTGAPQAGGGGGTTALEAKWGDPQWYADQKAANGPKWASTPDAEGKTPVDRQLQASYAGRMNGQRR